MSIKSNHFRWMIIHVLAAALGNQRHSLQPENRNIWTIDYFDDFEAHLRVEMDGKSILESDEEQVSINVFMQSASLLAEKTGYLGDFPVGAAESDDGAELRRDAYAAIVEMMRNGIGPVKNERELFDSADFSTKLKQGDNDRWRLYWIFNRPFGLFWEYPLLDGAYALTDIPLIIETWLADETLKKDIFESVEETESVTRFARSLRAAISATGPPQTLDKIISTSFGDEVPFCAGVARSQMEQNGIGRFTETLMLGSR